MSLQTKSFRSGKLVGTVLDFQIGDVLPMHRHKEQDVHITIVSRGSIRIHGPEIGDTVYHAGAVIDWDINVDHEFVGVENNSRIINLLKWG